MPSNTEGNRRVWTRVVDADSHEAGFAEGRASVKAKDRKREICPDCAMPMCECAFEPEEVDEPGLEPSDIEDIYLARVKRAKKATDVQDAGSLGRTWSSAYAADVDVLARALQGAQERERRLGRHLDQALRQWRMYANESRQFDGDWIEESDDPEAVLYREAAKASPGEEIGGEDS